MKCPECGFNQKYSEGMRCGKCKRLFTLDPKQQKMSDGKFLAAVRRASYQGTVKFTEHQLYAAYAKNAVSPRGCFRFFSVLLFVAAAIAFFLGEQNYTIALVVFSVLAFVSSFIVPAGVLSPNEFESCVLKWKSGRRKVEGMLEVPTLYKPPEQWPEKDIYDYGVEQILIVNRDILVDMFVLNNRHAELRMLVVSEKGYPDYIAMQVNRLLAERSDLPVYLLHDATHSPDEMRKRLERKAKWLELGENPVVDMGLMQEDVYRLKQTENFRRYFQDCLIPADALLLAPLCRGLSACFTNESTFADEIAKGAAGDGAAQSSFG